MKRFVLFLAMFVIAAPVTPVVQVKTAEAGIFCFKCKPKRTRRRLRFRSVKKTSTRTVTRSRGLVSPPKIEVEAGGKAPVVNP